MGWVAGYGWGGVVARFFVYFVFFLVTFGKMSDEWRRVGWGRHLDQERLSDGEYFRSA